MNDKLEHRLYITYRDHHGWEHVESRLQKYMIIQDLKWVSKDDVFTQDVVCDVDVGFLAQAQYDRMAGQQATLPFVNLHQEPYVKLFFVAPKDYEEYKTDVRPVLRDWVNSFQDKDVEYLIVYIDLNKKQGMLDKLNLRSIFGNLQTEFNKTKYDRVCQFKPNSREESDSTWQDFWLRLKEALGRSVERVVEQYKREVKKLLGERPLPGWNFCKYFTVVEGLAFVYEALRLYEDALNLYDDLEAFQLSMDEREIALPLFGGNEKGDDSGSVLDFNKKNYRMKIATSTITEFDFRQYLFARQCKLLFCHGRPVKLAERAMNFIRTFTRLLHAEKFNERYCNSWAFTAYMDVAETLRATILRGGVGGAVTNLSPLKSTDPAAIAEHLAKTPKLSARNLQRLNYLLGDIYYNARVTLEHLGSSYNLLPRDRRVILSEESLKQFNITGLESTNTSNQVLPTNRKLFLEEGKNDVQLMEILDSDSKPEEKLEEESLDKENARKALEQLSLSQSPPPDAIIPPPEGVHVEGEPLTDVKESTEPVPMSPEKKKKRRRGSLRSKTDKNSDESDESEDEEDEDKSDSVDQSAAATDSADPAQPTEDSVHDSSEQSNVNTTSAQDETKSSENTASELTNQSTGQQNAPTTAQTNESKPSENTASDVKTDSPQQPVSDTQSAAHKTDEPKSDKNDVQSTPSVSENKTEVPSDSKTAQNTPSTENTAVTPVKSSTPTNTKRDLSGKVDFNKIRDGTFEITHPILITGTANEASFDKLYTSLTNKAIQCFTDVERHRSVMRLSQELGNLHFVRGNYDNAVTLLKSVLNLTNSAASAGSSVDNWHPLSFVVHHRLALVHLMNNNFNDFLTSLIELLSPPMLALLDDSDERARLQQWYFDLLLHVSKHKLSVVSEQSMSSVVEPAISFPGFGFTRQCNMRDTVTINVHLTSSLPQTLVADKLCLQLFSQKRAAKTSKLLSGDKTPRGGEEKPNFVVIDLTGVNLVPGKNVYSLTFKPPSKSRYICYKLWIEIGNLILSQTLLPPSIDNPHQLQRKHYKTFNYNNIANNQRIWSINVAHSSPTALLHVNLPEHGHMVVGCWQTVQVVIDTEEDQLTNKPSLYIKSKNLITTTGSAVQTPLEESSDGIADTPLSTPAEEKKDEKNKDTSNTTNKGPVEFPLVIPDKCQLKAKVTTGDTTSEVTVQLVNGQVTLPTLGTHARIEFDLPLKALHSTDHIHEVSFTLKYREACNEKFVINQLSDLNFIQPFNTAQFILANKPNNRILLRVILESLCPSPIEIIEYRRDASADESNKDYKAVLDCNHYIKAMTIKPKEKVSLLFELEKLVQKSATQGTSGALKTSDEELINNALLVAFTFYYRFTKYEHKEIGRVKVDPRHNIYNTPYLEWKHFVHFDELNKNPMLERTLTGPMPSDQYDYEYSLSTPHTDEPHLKGHWIQVTVRVHRLTKTSTAPPAEISFRLEYDTASWLVSGKIRGYLRPSATGHEHVLNFKMLPLVAGQLPLPSLQLDNLSLLFKSTNINHYYYANYAQRDDTSRDQHVIVFPQTNVMSVTEKIVLNDPLSKPYFT